MSSPKAPRPLKTPKKAPPFPVLAGLLILAGLAAQAAGQGGLHAHAVYVFAYADGDRICADSYFSKKSRVAGGTVTMSDTAGNVLETGTTLEDGSYCFKSPGVPGDLRFAVLAGEGHRG